MNKQLSLVRENKKDYGFDEAIKTLRTNIQFSGNGIKVIMLTSAFPSEGKSELTFSTAESLTQLGKRVLLVDADIRKSVFVSRYQLKEQINGLSQYLSGQKTLDEVIYPTNVEHLDVIAAGPYSPNPTELLEDTLFRDLIVHARKEYDYVLIDTPPMADLIDGAVIARLCDGVILVIESGNVSFHVEQGIKKQLEKSGCRILGAVLNKQPLDKHGYYSRYGKYGYRYGSKYYNKYYDAEQS